MSLTPDTTTNFLVDLFVLFAGSVLAGEVAVRLGQAALVGQLLVGVVLGPTLMGPYLGLTSLTPELSAIQFLATVFILFMAGLEVVPEDIARMGLPNALLGVAVFVIPFLVGGIATYFLFPGAGTLSYLFLALTLSITALPVMGIMLSEFGLTGRPMGRWLLNAALLNELSAVAVFAVLLKLYSGGTSGIVAVAEATLAVGIFLTAILAVHMAIMSLRLSRQWPRWEPRIARLWRNREGGFAILMILVVGATLFSQALGLTFVVGAFYAGLLVTRRSAGTKAHRSISGVFDAMSWGFFIPLFFALVGVQMDLRLLLPEGYLVAFFVLLAVATLTKVGTGGLLARALGWSRPDALAMGWLVNSRGAVELAMAVILLGSGVFNAAQFTLVAGVGLVTTMLAPAGAKGAWTRDPTARREFFLRAPRFRPAGEPGPLTSPPEPPTPV